MGSYVIREGMMMIGKPKTKRRFSRWWLWILMAVVAYPLSLGPVMFVYGIMGIEQPEGGIFETYHLDWLGSHFPDGLIAYNTYYYGPCFRAGLYVNHKLGLPKSESSGQYFD
jgi:hypothetical protein